MIYFSKGSYKIVDLLIKAGANVNAVDANSNTPLHLVERETHRDKRNTFAIVELLVNAGADVNAKNEDNKTPLDLAKSDESKLNQLIKKMDLN